MSGFVSYLIFFHRRIEPKHRDAWAQPAMDASSLFNAGIVGFYAIGG